jgi:hypothetical protein
MISELPLRASENNEPESLISRMQSSLALLSRYRRAVGPRQKLGPVDGVSPCLPPQKPDSFPGGALMLHNLPWTASSRVQAA